MSAVMMSTTGQPPFRGETVEAALEGAFSVRGAYARCMGGLLGLS